MSSYAVSQNCFFGPYVEHKNIWKLCIQRTQFYQYFSDRFHACVRCGRISTQGTFTVFLTSCTRRQNEIAAGHCSCYQGWWLCRSESMRHRLSGYILLELLLCVDSSPKSTRAGNMYQVLKLLQGKSWSLIMNGNNAALKVCAWPVCSQNRGFTICGSRSCYQCSMYRHYLTTKVGVHTLCRESKQCCLSQKHDKTVVDMITRPADTKWKSNYILLEPVQKKTVCH